MTNADVTEEWVTAVTTKSEYKDLYAVFKRHNLVPDHTTESGKAITKLLYKCKTQEIYFKAGHNAERNREYLAQSLSFSYGVEGISPLFPAFISFPPICVRGGDRLTSEDVRLRQYQLCFVDCPGCIR